MNCGSYVTKPTTLRAQSQHWLSHFSGIAAMGVKLHRACLHDTTGGGYVSELQAPPLLRGCASKFYSLPANHNKSSAFKHSTFKAVSIMFSQSWQQVPLLHFNGSFIKRNFVHFVYFFFSYKNLLPFLFSYWDRRWGLRQISTLHFGAASFCDLWSSSKQSSCLQSMLLTITKHTVYISEV